jgi:hypothetical protein
MEEEAPQGGACPRCGYERQPHDIAPPTECPRCGIIFAKYLAAQARKAAAAAAPSAPAEPRGLLALLTHVPDKVDRMDFAGRVLALVLIGVWGLRLLALPYRGPALGDSFLHRVDLVFHEAGHVLFMLFGEFMTVLGGSLLQCLVPLVLFSVALLRYRAPFTAAVCLWWVGQNLLDLAPYIADARAMDLPLLGEMDEEDVATRPERHDWHRLLLWMGWLHRDLQLARLSFLLGGVLMGAAVVWGGLLLVRQRRRLRAGYFAGEKEGS